MNLFRPHYLNQLADKMNNRMVKVVTGLHLAGKFYLMFGSFKDYILKKGIAGNQIFEIILYSDDYC